MTMLNQTHPGAGQDVNNRKPDSQENDPRTTESDSENTDEGINKLFSEINTKGE